MTKKPDIQAQTDLYMKVQGILAGHPVQVCIGALLECLTTAMATAKNSPDEIDKVIDKELSPMLKKTIRNKLKKMHPDR